MIKAFLKSTVFVSWQKQILPMGPEETKISQHILAI
jgi:hypothetical protein